MAQVADKLMNSEPNKGWHTAEGIDLKVGGEGMKGFYDQMLPKMANKLVKPFGSKVEQTSLGGTGEASPDFLRSMEPRTSEEHAAYGTLEQHDFHFGNAVEDAQHRIREAQGDGPAAVQYGQDVFDVLQKWGKRATPQGQSTPIHSLKITPELRKAAMTKGFPLFSAGAIAAPVFGSMAPGSDTGQ